MHRAWVALVAVLVSGTPSAAGDRWRQGLESANRAIEEGRVDEAEVTLRRVVQAAERAGAGVERFDALLGLADLLRAEGRTEEAEVHAARALAIAESNGGDAASIRAWHVLGSVRAAGGERREAEWHYRRVLEARERTLGTNDVALAPVLADLGVVLADSGRLVEADDVLRRAVALSGRPGATHRAVGTAVASLNGLGNVREAFSDVSGAEALYRRALALADGPLRGVRLSGEPLATTLENLAAVIVEQGRLSEAETHARRALAIREHARGSHHPRLAHALNTLALVKAGRRKFREAEDLLRRASRLADLGRGAEAVGAGVLANRGALRLLIGRPGDAEPLLERALSRAEGLVGHDHPALVPLLQVLGHCYRLRTRAPEAEAAYVRALEITGRFHGARHSSSLVSLAGLGLVAEQLGQLDRAAWFHTEALAVAEHELDPAHPDRAMALGNLATLHRKRGDAVRAEPLYLQALEVFGDDREDDPRRAAILEGLASLYNAAGRRADARRIERRLAALAPSAPAAIWSTGLAFPAAER